MNLQVVCFVLLQPIIILLVFLFLYHAIWRHISRVHSLSCAFNIPIWWCDLPSLSSPSTSLYTTLLSLFWSHLSSPLYLSSALCPLLFAPILPKAIPPSVLWPSPGHQTSFFKVLNSSSYISILSLLDLSCMISQNRTAPSPAISLVCYARYFYTSYLFYLFYSVLLQHTSNTTFASLQHAVSFHPSA